MSLLLKNALVVDPSQDLEEKAAILVEAGRVARIGRIAARKSWDVIDLPGCIACPGLIDMHVHLREPGREDKETVSSGARAAAAGGFSSLMCMPNTDPVNDNEAVTRFVIDRSRRTRAANVHPAGAVTKGQLGKDLAEIGEMVKAGVVAISDDGHPVENDQIMRRALEYSKIFDIPVVDHCENRDLAAGGCMNEGATSTRLGLPGMSRLAEEMDVVRDLILSRETGGRVHIAHLSTRESLHWIREAKKQGIAVTCEVTPHHFLISDEKVATYDTNYKMHPPLREQADVEAMREGLADGSIDCIATDHAPHTTLEKDTTFEDAAPGIVGLETAVPLVWTFLVQPGLIGVRRMVELMSVNPDRILRLGRGTLKPGSVADVTVIDPDRAWTVDVQRFKSKSRNSPFDGWELRGRAVLTLVGGRVVHRLPAGR